MVYCVGIVTTSYAHTSMHPEHELPELLPVFTSRTVLAHNRLLLCGVL